LPVAGVFHLQPLTKRFPILSKALVFKGIAIYSRNKNISTNNFLEKSHNVLLSIFFSDIFNEIDVKPS